MLYLVGLGLGDSQDITLKGLEVLRTCDSLFLDAYTSILCSQNHETLEALYGKKVKLADRELVEQGAEEILTAAESGNAAFLVVGDPFGATTHTDLTLRAAQRGIRFKVVHNASILTAIGVTGLQLYHFGEVVSIPLWEDSWRPTSYVAKIAENRSRGLHTLCLLDIKVKEQSVENLARGRKVYEPARFMSCAQAADQLTQVSDDDNHLAEDTLAVACVRLGADDQVVKVDTLGGMKVSDLGPPLHSLVIVGKLHHIEAEFLKLYADTDTAKKAVDDAMNE